MKRLPVGRQNFAAIIKEDLLYVDKTRQMYELIRTGNLYFLSRPRRFGKSLLVSTFQHLFSGKKALFKCLYIDEQTNYDWQAFPVLQFNLASYGHQIENLAEELHREIRAYANSFEVSIETTSLSTAFKTLVEGISKKGKPVVLLIDEYDKPIVDFLTEYDKAKKKSEGTKRLLFTIKRFRCKRAYSLFVHYRRF